MSDTKENKQVILRNVRLSFPQLFEAKSTKGGKPRFSASVLLDPKNAENKAQIKSLQADIEEVRKTDLKVKLAPDKVCLRKDGPWDGYEGMYYVSMANARKPQVVNRDKSPLLPEDGVVYAGCYVDVVLRLWAQNNEHGKRVNASLEIVRFRRDGEAFGATPPSTNVLDDLDDEEGDDDLGDNDGLDDDEDGL